MHKKLDEMKESTSYKEICEIKKDLVKIVGAELHSKGVDDLDAKEMGEVVDMIKDLAEAEKSLMEACYYEKVVKAMEESEDDERMGYNSRRYANGRYAPKGRGTRMGFVPPDWDEMHYVDAYIRDPNFYENIKMGYDGEGRGNRSQSGTRMGYADWERDPDYDPNQSKTYNEYRKAKRHYTETKSPTDKQDMENWHNRHLNEAIANFREMWKDADPNMKKQMRASLTALVGEMPT